jgi:hypothetical protein
MVTSSSPQMGISSQIILNDISFERELHCALRTVFFKSENVVFPVRDGRFSKSNELENLVVDFFRDDIFL